MHLNNLNAPVLNVLTSYQTTLIMSRSLPRRPVQCIGAIRRHSLPSIGSYIQLLAELVLISALR